MKKGKKTTEELLTLYRRVQRREPGAVCEFREYYRRAFPNNVDLASRTDTASLHTMYLHLVTPGGKSRSR